MTHPLLLYLAVVCWTCLRGMVPNARCIHVWHLFDETNQILARGPSAIEIALGLPKACCWCLLLFLKRRKKGVSNGQCPTLPHRLSLSGTYAQSSIGWFLLFANNWLGRLSKKKINSNPLVLIPLIINLFSYFLVIIAGYA